MSIIALCTQTSCLSSAQSAAYSVLIDNCSMCILTGTRTRTGTQRVMISCPYAAIAANSLQLVLSSTTTTQHVQRTGHLIVKKRRPTVLGQKYRICISSHKHIVSHMWSTWRWMTPQIQPGKHLKVTQTPTFFAKLSLINYIVTAPRTTPTAHRAQICVPVNLRTPTVWLLGGVQY